MQGCVIWLNPVIACIICYWYSAEIQLEARSCKCKYCRGGSFFQITAPCFTKHTMWNKIKEEKETDNSSVVQNLGVKDFFFEKANSFIVTEKQHRCPASLIQHIYRTKCNWLQKLKADDTWWFWSCWGPSQHSSGRGPAWAQVDQTHSSNSLPGSLFVDSGAPATEQVTQQTLTYMNIQ